MQQEYVSAVKTAQQNYLQTLCFPHLAFPLALLYNLPVTCEPNPPLPLLPRKKYRTGHFLSAHNPAYPLVSFPRFLLDGAANPSPLSNAQTPSFPDNPQSSYAYRSVSIRWPDIFFQPPLSISGGKNPILLHSGTSTPARFFLFRPSDILTIVNPGPSFFFPHKVRLFQSGSNLPKAFGYLLRSCRFYPLQ